MVLTNQTIAAVITVNQSNVRNARLEQLVAFGEYKSYSLQLDEHRFRKTKWLIMKGEMVQRGEATTIASGEYEVNLANPPSIYR